MALRPAEWHEWMMEGAHGTLAPSAFLRSDRVSVQRPHAMHHRRFPPPGRCHDHPAVDRGRSGYCIQDLKVVFWCSFSALRWSARYWNSGSCLAILCCRHALETLHLLDGPLACYRAPHHTSCECVLPVRLGKEKATACDYRKSLPLRNLPSQRTRDRDDAHRMDADFHHPYRARQVLSPVLPRQSRNP